MFFNPPHVGNVAVQMYQIEREVFKEYHRISGRCYTHTLTDRRVRLTVSRDRRRMKEINKKKKRRKKLNSLLLYCVCHCASSAKFYCESIEALLLHYTRVHLYTYAHVGRTLRIVTATYVWISTVFWLSGHCWNTPRSFVRPICQTDSFFWFTINSLQPSSSSSSSFFSCRSLYPRPGWEGKTGAGGHHLCEPAAEIFSVINKN